MKLDISDNKEYKMKVIKNNMVYIKESMSNHLLKLYFLVL